jgi:glucosamine--fructose-6-phosphate aminotransferase (isomerizing)
LVLEQARSSGAFTIGITNEAGSSLARLAEHVFLVRAGKEKSVAATKTYTGQLLSMYLLAYAMGAPIEREDLRRLAEYTAAALELESEISARAERYCFMRHAICIGRGLNYANSFEFALKLMETCYVVAERFSSADLLHGPIAMLEESFPAFIFGSAGVTWKPIQEMLDKLQSLKAQTLLITDRGNASAAEQKGTGLQVLTIARDLTHRTLPEDVYTPIPYIVPAQLFAASLAEVKHLDPDRPRTLSKITQTI